MPMENMVHMFGGTKRKSTLVSEAIIRFPREDEGSPRQKIVEQFCPGENKDFRACMTANGFDENKCLGPKGILDSCADKAFREVNANPEMIF
mmetsp:Transcript_16227/g.14162  ORF Transcript_16227/g.14162 Transcript_16227/m.14162 type:complete len:92 (+) Transcript_16227:40-315(+)